MAIWKLVTPDDAIEVLNRMIEADQQAAQQLVNGRVPCNRGLADDPTIQVGRRNGAIGWERSWEVGLLGIINGIFGIDDRGWGPIAAVFDTECQKCHAGCKLDGSSLSIKEPCPACGGPIKATRLIKFIRADLKAQNGTARNNIV